MTISVTQLNNYIRGVFDIDGVLNDLSVCGEITNVKRSFNGWYFTLKDDDAAINCFCYANAAPPVQGVMAVAEGQLNYFVKSGNVSFFVRRLCATDNTGAAYLRFIELKEKLSKEGLFDEAKKKQVPHSAAKIGVVTSETGAVIHDIDDVVHRRQPFSDVILYPVKVQGAGADVEIAEGIAYFAKSNVDVVIVGRGGGSNEDLSVFNSETVVRAIAECPKPIVSAVGHGIDFTLSDFAADKRAVTPSEAAEFVTLDAPREKFRICTQLEKIGNTAFFILSQHKQNVLNDCRLLYHGIGRKLDGMSDQVRYKLKSIESAALSATEKTSAALVNATDRISNLNPAKILKRGYGYVSAEKGVIRSVDEVSVGDNITVELYDGKIETQVTNKEKRK